MTYHDGAHHRGEDHATGDGGHKHGTTEFGVATQATKRKTEDGGKAELVSRGIISNNFYSFLRQGDTHRLETQDQNNHDHGGRTMGRHGGY